MEIEKRHLLTGILICSIISSITLFIYSHQFVNVEVTAKWLVLFLYLGVMGIVYSLFSQKINFPALPIFFLLIGCFLLVFIKDWLSSGINLSLLTYLCGLVLLFLIIQQITARCAPQHLFGVIIVFAVATSLHGILQYTGVIHSNKGIFSVTGSFDNPAGFTVALACVLPLCFYFINGTFSKYLKYMAMIASGIIAISVFLSGSRAGMVASVVAIAGWLVSKLKISRTISALILAFIFLTLSLGLYFFKKDSANGRLLIWRSTLDMVSDKPIMGHGQGAFQAKYMLYQADYFKTHPESQFAQFADNTLFPFNEYLLVLSEHGITGLSMIILLAFLLVRAYRRNRNDERLVALLSLLALSVFSFFSYPFKYPFTWALMFLNITIIGNSKHQKGWIPCASVFMISSLLLAYTSILIYAETRWNNIAHRSLSGQTHKVLPEYDKLYRLLGKNGLFLYNHAAELNEAKEFEKSNVIFKRCTLYFNDMDVQMLLANNYRELGKYVEAEQHLKMAADMCPARFMPMYELVKLYETINRIDEALTTAHIIVNKDVKISSSTLPR